VIPLRPHRLTHPPKKPPNLIKNLNPKKPSNLRNHLHLRHLALVVRDLEVGRPVAELALALVLEPKLVLEPAQEPPVVVLDRAAAQEVDLEVVRDLEVDLAPEVVLAQVALALEVVQDRVRDRAPLAPELELAPPDRDREVEADLDLDLGLEVVPPVVDLAREVVPPAVVRDLEVVLAPALDREVAPAPVRAPALDLVLAQAPKRFLVLLIY